MHGEDEVGTDLPEDTEEAAIQDAMMPEAEQDPRPMDYQRPLFFRLARHDVGGLPPPVRDKQMNLEFPRFIHGPVYTPAR